MSSLLSRRNKLLAIIALVGFGVSIAFLGKFVSRNPLPSLLSETKPEELGKPRVFKTNLKVTNNFYGVDKDGVLIPEFANLPAGKFLMGSAEGDGAITEQPQHEITVSAFSISRTEITNAQFLSFCQATKRKLPEDPHWQGVYMRDYPNHPIVNVSWQDAVDYGQWLSKVLGKEVRLPTEAEWEYAAQGSGAGTTLEFAARELLPTTKVASYAPSPTGLYDMLGNVWEWCLDWYVPQYYQESPKENPIGPLTGDLKVIRGGSWAESLRASRISHRNRATPKGGSPTIGFRVIISEVSSSK